MQFGPVTKFYKRNTSTSKKIDYNIMSANPDAIVFFPIYSKFAATRFSLIKPFYLTEPENRTKKSLTQLLNYCF